jgi:hypothetical protein
MSLLHNDRNQRYSRSSRTCDNNKKCFNTDTYNNNYKCDDVKERDDKCRGGVRLDITYSSPSTTPPFTISATGPTELPLSSPEEIIIGGPTTVSSIISSKYSYKSLECSSIFNPLVGRLYSAVVAGTPYATFVGNVSMYLGPSTLIGINGTSLFIQSTGVPITLPVAAPLIFIANNFNNCFNNNTIRDPCIFFNSTTILTTGSSSVPTILAQPLSGINTSPAMSFVPDVLFTEADIPYLTPPSSLSSCFNGRELLTFKVYSPSVTTGSASLLGATSSGLPNTRDSNLLGEVILTASGTGASLTITAFSLDCCPILIPAGSLFVSDPCGEIQIIVFGNSASTS